MKAADKRRAKADVYKRAKGRCEYCNWPLSMEQATLDHWLSKALGGTNERHNLRLACKPCNEEKADMTPYEWILHLAKKDTR